MALREAPKTQKSVRTRMRIMGVARDLMQELGNAEFQMSEVAERCQMSKGSLYYYFSDRDELLAATFDEVAEELTRAIKVETDCAQSAREALRGIYSCLSRRLEMGGPLVLAMLHELSGRNLPTGQPHASRFSQAVRAVVEQIDRAKGEGVIRREVDSGLTAVFMAGALLATSLVEVEDSAREDTTALSLYVADLMMHGAGAEEERYV